MTIDIPYRLVIVKWEDSYTGDPGWSNLHDTECEPLLMVSIGFLVKENRQRIKLFQNIQPCDDPEKFRGSGFIIIPRSVIKSIKDLKV